MTISLTPKVKFISAEVDLGSPMGTFTLSSSGGIGGKPFPSESEAHEFRRRITLCEQIMGMNYYALLKLETTMREK